MEKLVDTSDRMDKCPRSGIRSRYFADKPYQCGYGVCQAAEEGARRTPKSRPEDIAAMHSMHLYTRTTTRRECPVRWPAGLAYPKTALSFDLNGACSGFHLRMRNGQRESLSCKARVRSMLLVIGSEKISPLVDMQDRSTCVLFGDGARSCGRSNTDSSDADFVVSYGGLRTGQTGVLGCDGKAHHITNGRDRRSTDSPSARRQPA